MQGATNEVIEYILDSDLREVDKIIKILEDVGAKCNLSDDDLGSCVISVSEAITNAIRHGNKESSDKKVHFKIIISIDDVEFIITDQGEGFLEHTVPNPLEEDNLLRDSGRGVLIIKTMMDDVIITPSSTGTTIRMKKVFKK